MSNQERSDPSGTLASTNHSRAARRATSAAHSGCLVQTGGAASAAWRPLAVLAAAWGLAAAAPPNPAKVCAASMAANAAAAHPAAAGQHSRPVPRSRLCGGCSPWPPCCPSVPVSRRARTRPGGRRGAAGGCCGGAPASQGGRAWRRFFRPPVPPPVAAAAAALTRQPRSSQGRKKKCTNQKTGAGKVHRFACNILCTLPLPPPQ